MEKCVDGDDRGNYIEAGTNSSYLLYWWHKLDNEGFVQFTICVLDRFQRANSTIFQLVSSEHNASSPGRAGRRDDRTQREMSENMGRIGDGIRTMSVIHARREIETWQKELYNVQEVMD